VEEEAKAAGKGLTGHNVAVDVLETQSSSRQLVSSSPSSAKVALPPLQLPGSKGGPESPAPFVRDAINVPDGFEEDDADPFSRAAKEQEMPEEWWKQTKGARDATMATDQSKMQVAIRAFQGKRVGFGDDSKHRFDPTAWGGQQNYVDIERAVDADMRGYGDFAPPTEVRELRGECVVQVTASG